MLLLPYQLISHVTEIKQNRKLFNNCQIFWYRAIKTLSVVFHPCSKPFNHHCSSLHSTYNVTTARQNQLPFCYTPDHTRATANLTQKHVSISRKYLPHLIAIKTPNESKNIQSTCSNQDHNYFPFLIKNACFQTFSANISHTPFVKLLRVLSELQDPWLLLMTSSIDKRYENTNEGLFHCGVLQFPLIHDQIDFQICIKSIVIPIFLRTYQEVKGICSIPNYLSSFYVLTTYWHDHSLLN